MQQRYYDPIAGRFLSVDPVTTDVKTGQGFNRYAYANNSPYRFKDPDGRFAVPLLPVIIQAVAAAIGTNAGAAAVGIAGGVAIGAAIASTGAQGDSKAAGSGNAGPAAGKEPAGAGINKPGEANSADKPAGVPDNWREDPTKGVGGRQWVNPDNPGDRVRVMPGSPDSSNPGQREPYVRDVRNGNQWLDVNGNRIEGKTGRNSPDTHVPLKDYVFRP